MGAEEHCEEIRPGCSVNAPGPPGQTGVQGERRGDGWARKIAEKIQGGCSVNAPGPPGQVGVKGRGADPLGRESSGKTGRMGPGP